MSRKVGTSTTDTGLQGGGEGGGGGMGAAAGEGTGGVHRLEGIRITTWNVNGIRNPFSYQPWIDLKTYAAMFDTLEADIICFQELKIQKRELTDAMVLVPGWDCYFTFPKYKKGYSGVAIYTRQSKVSPIKAEEGITGYLTGPNSTTSYIDLPPSQQIGGYPTSLSREQSLTLDSEGRAVILDFGAFVLIGTYSPANRDSSRDEFRTEFVRALFERCRNLIESGRKVVLTGDLNIARDEIDSAHAREAMSKTGVMDFKKLSECRMMFDELLEPNRNGVMVDLCREWWKDRRGMYTCWEQRIQARPGNYGARIDYVCCSSDMNTWFMDANIQEGLMGSDHCPVYAVLKPIVSIADPFTGKITETYLLDIINPPGMFINGIEQASFRASKAYQTPKLCGRLMPEFAARRSIKEMFTKKAPAATPAARTNTSESKVSAADREDTSSREGTHTNTRLPSPAAPNSMESGTVDTIVHQAPSRVIDVSSMTSTNRKQAASTSKRVLPSIELTDTTDKRRKRGAGMRSNAAASSLNLVKSSSSGTQGQQKQSRLSGFFKPMSSVESSNGAGKGKCSNSGRADGLEAASDLNSVSVGSQGESTDLGMRKATDVQTSTCNGSSPKITEWEGEGEGAANAVDTTDSSQSVHDPIATKETWDKLFTPKPPPRCEGHGEPAKRLVTKKKGGNRGRAFWVCARPVGPDGEQQTSTISGNGGVAGEWRCNFFMWCSDWSGSEM